MARGPVGHTCPDIDTVIGGIEAAQNALKGLVDMMEDLRTANDKLRDWGSEQEDKVNDLESQLDNANRKIAELESEIEELKS